MCKLSWAPNASCNKGRVGCACVAERQAPSLTCIYLQDRLRSSASSTEMERPDWTGGETGLAYTACPRTATLPA